MHDSDSEISESDTDEVNIESNSSTYEPNESGSQNLFVLARKGLSNKLVSFLKENPSSINARNKVNSVSCI